MLFQGKLDWSRHEHAWANILHREIFETGRYFKKNELTPFKNKNKKSVRKNRESSEEDEGFEVLLKKKCTEMNDYISENLRTEQVTNHMSKWFNFHQENIWII